jgi:hypothetical protein
MISKLILAKIAFVILICTAVIGPAAAATGYSVSVSTYGNGLPSSQFSPSKLSVLNDYNINKGTINAIPITGTGKINNPGSFESSGFMPSIGSVSAYSKMNSMQKTENGCIAMEYSDRVSMSGSIYTFEYSISFL